MRQTAVRWALVCGLVMLALSLPAQDTKDRVAIQRQVHATAPTNILILFSDGKQPQDLPAHDAAPMPRVTPALSPDGRTLAFSAKVGEQFKLFTWELDPQNLPVGEPKVVTANADTSDKFPSWSPDGKQLAYLATAADGKISLRTINRDGTDIRTLAETRYTSTPTWRADMKALLYIDLEEGDDGKPIATLKNVAIDGNMPLPVRPGMRIIAASQAPPAANDNLSIAVLAQSANGLCDLNIIKPFGVETKKIASQIAGAKSVVWVSPTLIAFTATKVGAQEKAIWLVNPEGGAAPRPLEKVPVNPKMVAYLSMRTANLAANLPDPVDPGAPAGPNGMKAGEPLATGPVTIMRPLTDTVIRGIVPVKIYTQPKVTSVVLRINDQFIFAAAPQPDETEPAPYVRFEWNTQQVVSDDLLRAEIESAEKDKRPIKYTNVLRFPDGVYTITAQGLDINNKMVGGYQVKVTVQNSLAGDEFPVENTVLAYKGRDDVFALRGEATLFGASPGQAPELNATLDLTIRRVLIDARDTAYDLRTEVRPPRSGFSLNYGLKEAMIPETGASALYSFTREGYVSVVEQLREKIYLPLSALSTPLPPNIAVTRASTWSRAMNVVVDLLNRDNTMVQANHAVDGVEWVDGKRTIRIRSDFKLDPRWTPYPLLPATPTRTTPQERAIRGELLKKAAQPTLVPGANPGMTAPAGTDVTQNVGDGIKFTACSGIRFSWFDYQSSALVRVDDYILYSFPVTNLPTASGGTDGMGMPGVAAPPPGDAPPPLGAPGNNPFGGTAPAANPFGGAAAPANNNPFGGGTGTQPARPATQPKIGTAYYLVRMSYKAVTEE
ncbi:MAG: translocation protein TolB [bacterium ADurb.Bin429]|nr:MAG: translocation protein TolB [bacterium ADurb.Bin429]